MDGTDGAPYLIISGYSSHTSIEGAAGNKQDSIEPEDSTIPVAHPITDTSEPCTKSDSSTLASCKLRPPSPQSSAAPSAAAQGKMELKVSYNKFERRIKLPPTVDRNRVTTSYGMSVVECLHCGGFLGRSNSKANPEIAEIRRIWSSCVVICVDSSLKIGKTAAQIVE